MSVDVYLPFLAVICFGTAGVRLAGRLRPAHATWLLTCGAVVTSACSLCSLALLTWALLGRFSLVASLGDWSTTVFRHHDPVSLAASIPALVLLVLVCGRATRALVCHVRSLLEAYATCRRLPPALGELVVVADDHVDAFALPGRPGRIIVSDRAVASLSPIERAAVFAHERSHLRHRHHLHLMAVALASAANPLLCKVPRATSYAVERWADEDAAQELLTPDPVASALCRTVGPRWQRRPDPARRVAALRRAPQRGDRLILLLTAAGLAALVFISAEAATDAGQLWHNASIDATAPHHTQIPH